MFLKFHFLTESQSLVTLTIVDLAGYPNEVKRLKEQA